MIWEILRLAPLAALAGPLLLAAPAAAQTATLVRDINSGPTAAVLRPNGPLSIIGSTLPLSSQETA